MECSICLEPLIYNIAVLECIHKFHENCISDWLGRKKTNTCPICETGTGIVTLIRSKEEQLETLILKNAKHSSINPIVKRMRYLAPLVPSNKCKCICQ